MSALSSITPHLLLAPDRAAAALMDGCPTRFLSNSHSVRSRLLIFLHLVSLHSPMTRCLHRFVIRLCVASSYSTIIQSISPLCRYLYFYLFFLRVYSARLNDCLCSRCKQTQTLKLLEQRDLSVSVCCHLSVRISVSSVCLHSILRSKCCGPSSSTSLL